MSDDQSLQYVALNTFQNLESSFALAAMEQWQQVNSDSSGVLRPLLVQGHMPVSGRVFPQFPHWGEVSLLCHSIPLTNPQGFLQYRYIMYKMANFNFMCILSDALNSVSRFQCLNSVTYLGLRASVFLPLSAVIVVLFPLLAGWGGTKSVIVVKTILQTFAMSVFAPIVITGSRWLCEQTKTGIIIKINLYKLYVRCNMQEHKGSTWGVLNMYGWLFFLKTFCLYGLRIGDFKNKWKKWKNATEDFRKRPYWNKNSRN